MAKHVERFTVTVAKHVEQLFASWGVETFLAKDRATLLAAAIEAGYAFAHLALGSRVLTGDQTHEIRVLVEGHVDQWIARAQRGTVR